jgi:hypothetical protein
MQSSMSGVCLRSRPATVDQHRDGHQTRRAHLNSNASLTVLTPFACQATIAAKARDKSSMLRASNLRTPTPSAAATRGVSFDRIAFGSPASQGQIAGNRIGQRHSGGESRNDSATVSH